jgi:hypothetical protein
MSNEPIETMSHTARQYLTLLSQAVQQLSLIQQTRNRRAGSEPGSPTVIASNRLNARRSRL